MQDPRAIAVVERLGRTGIVALGAGGVALVIAALPAITPLAADVALVIAGASGVGGAGWAWLVRQRLLGLPLELAPIAGRGTVDGAVIYRFRARLGHGRALRDPRVEVIFEPAEGAPVALTALVPATSMCGPFTLVVRDERGVVGEGVLRVRIEVRAGGRTWPAEATYPTREIAAGRFGPDHWERLHPEEGPV